MTAPGTRLLVLSGPTASGKTSLALALAQRLPLEIVNADSMQVYRGMDIGTAKPTPEERARVPHHLIDVADPDEEYTAGRFVAEAEAAIRESGPGDGGRWSRGARECTSGPSARGSTRSRRTRPSGPGSPGAGRR